MARFAFEARDASGRAVRGVELARDEGELDRHLANLDLLLIRAQATQPERARGSSARALIDLCYHLSVVTEAGIPIIQGLRDLADEGHHPLQSVVADLARSIEGGSTLSDALARYPEHFPKLMIGVVQAGEESGKLDRVLDDLVRYLEWREELRRQVIGALSYPATVLAGVVGLGALVTVWVLPRFLELFGDMGVELPASTRALMAFHDFVTQWGWLVALLLLATGVAFALALRSEEGRRHFDTALLRLPIVGRLVLMTEMARFTHNLALFYSAGIPLVRALGMTTAIVQNRRVRSVIDEGRERVENGESLTEALSRDQLIPALVERMVSVGEVTGRLDEALGRVARYYDREIPALVSKALGTFNMGILLVLGGAIVMTVLSIFVPLYQMIGSIDA